MIFENLTDAELLRMADQRKGEDPLLDAIAERLDMRHRDVEDAERLRCLPWQQLPLF